MRCNDCHYPLWNTKTRRCPECGTSFSASEFEFAPGGVRFCCPYCDHPYLGTNSKGQLEPDAFACLSCGQSIDVESMVLREGLGVEEARAMLHQMPWLDRKERGLFRAWFETVGQGLASPSSLIGATQVQSSLLQAWLFSSITLCVIYLIGLGIPHGIQSLLGTANPTSISRFTLGNYSVAVPSVAYPISSVVGLIVFILVWIGFAHVSLVVTGAVKYGIRRTAQALLYSSGANLLAIVPCIGPLFGWIGWAFAAALMLKAGQHVHGARAAVAACVPPLVMAVMLVAVSFVVTPFITTVYGPTPLTSKATVVGYQVLWFVSASSRNLGYGPDHASELLLTLGTSPFLDTNTSTTADDVPLGDGTLAEFETASRPAQLAMIVKAIESQPNGTVAHRFGDLLFTYHGIDLWTADSRLWIVVMFPDPDVNSIPSAGDVIQIVTAHGSEQVTTYDRLPLLLKEQNTLRKALGIPQLPDLITITHARPASRAVPE